METLTDTCTVLKTKWRRLQFKMHVFAEYSLLAMIDSYPASKCTTQNMYTCVCAGLGYLQAQKDRLIIPR